MGDGRPEDLVVEGGVLGVRVAGWGLELFGERPTMILFAAIVGLGALVVLAGKDLRRVPVAARWESYAREQGLSAGESD